MTIDSSQPFVALPAEALVGEWVNADLNTRSIKRFVMSVWRYASVTPLRIQTFGSGSGGTEEIPHDPTGVNLFCESVRWDNPMYLSALARQDSGYAEYYIILKFISETEIVMDQYTIFKDSSERRHYMSTARFLKTPGSGIDASDFATENEDDDSEEQSPAEQLTGQPFPLADLIDLNGTAVQESELRGKPLLVDFFATWCGPCKRASPMLQKLHDTYSPRGLVVIGASTGEGDEDNRGAEVRNKVTRYAEEHRLTYLVTYGNDEWSGRCGVNGFPTFFFVGADGIVRDVLIGYGDGMQSLFEEKIEVLLSSVG